MTNENPDKPSKEKPWNIHSWEDLRLELSHMQRRSKLYEIVRVEMKKRDLWKPYRKKTR